MNDILRDIGTIARSLDAIANIEFKKINLHLPAVMKKQTLVFEGLLSYLLKLFDCSDSFK